MKDWRFACTTTLLAVLGSSTGCQQPPPITHETRHFEIATDFDDPVCEGTLNYFEDHLDFLETEFGQLLPHDTKIRLYWLEDSLDEWCRPGATGCFYPGTQIMFAQSQSITHEMVHVLLNAEAHTSLFIEEGLAELYSGMGTRYLRAEDEEPPVAELTWLTPEEYRDRKLDYALAGHFATWIRRELGSTISRRLAGVVAEGGGPEELQSELDQLGLLSLEEIEAEYAENYRINYGGLRDSQVPELELGMGTQITLRCDDEFTMGPLPDGNGGMYRTLRLVSNAPQLLDLHLYAGPEVRLDVIDTRLERKRGRIVDFSMPQPSEHLEHPHLSGDQETELEIHAGTYLLYLSTRSYKAQDITIQANVRRLPLPEPELPPEEGEGPQ